jgi:hypothetical protein
MAESVFTKEALAKIDECLVNGIRSVSFGDKSITFHSLDEMLKLRNQIARYLAGKDGVQVITPIVMKGFF